MSYRVRRDAALADLVDHYDRKYGEKSDGAEQRPLTVGSGDTRPVGHPSSGSGVSDRRVVYICLDCETGLSGFAAASEHAQTQKHPTERLVLSQERRRGRKGEGHQVKWSSSWTAERIPDDGL